MGNGCMLKCRLISSFKTELQFVCFACCAIANRTLNIVTPNDYDQIWILFHPLIRRKPCKCLIKLTVTVKNRMSGHTTTITTTRTTTATATIFIHMQNFCSRTNNHVYVENCLRKYSFLNHRIAMGDFEMKRESRYRWERKKKQQLKSNIGNHLNIPIKFVQIEHAWHLLRCSASEPDFIAHDNLIKV